MTRYTDFWFNKKRLSGWLIIFYFCTISICFHHLYWVPSSVPASASPELFSEERAFKHIVVLADEIGHRQVSTNGLQRANAYVASELRKLAEQNSEREDVDLVVSIESVSGAVAMDFMGFNFTNAYHNLTNTLFIIQPKACSADIPAVLLVAHTDSPLSSKGAADDACQVATMIELARAVLAGPRPIRLAAPLILLFTGGEETLSQAAHGFMNSSPWASRVGAFINLEAVGSEGLLTVFQHTGAWVIEAYAQGALHPIGTRVGQDLFDMKLIPADTDYRMLSADHYGNLPGLDMAYIKGSRIYHTSLDTHDKIKKGTLQDGGSTVMAIVFKIAEMLAANPKLPHDEKETSSKAVFADILGHAMIVIREDTAILYFMCLAAAYGLALASMVAAGQVLSVIQGLFRTLRSVVLAVALPAAFGAARVYLTGAPMVWYAHSWIMVVTYLPLALVGLMLPWSGLENIMDRHRPKTRGSFIAGQVLGVGLFCLAGAAGLQQVHAIGIASNLAFSALSCLMAALLLVGRGRLFLPNLLGILAVAAVPMMMQIAIFFTSTVYLSERVSLTGHVSPYMADVMVGALCGCTVLAASLAGGLVVLVGLVTPGRRRFSRLLKVVIAVVLLTAVLNVIGFKSYTADAPKRLLVNHIVETQASSPAAPIEVEVPLVPSTDDTVSADAIPADSDIVATAQATCTANTEQTCKRAPRDFSTGSRMVVVDSKFALANVDSTPLGALHGSLAFLSSQLTGSRVSGRELTPVYPAKKILESAVLPAPLPSPKEQLPYLELASTEAQGSFWRSHFIIHCIQPAWGVLNITGALSSWSFTPSLHGSSSEGGAIENIVRFTTETQNAQVSFWVDSKQQPTSLKAKEVASNLALEEQIRVELSIMYLEQTSPLSDFIAQLPNWVMPMLEVTTYQSAWEL